MIQKKSITAFVFLSIAICCNMAYAQPVTTPTRVAIVASQIIVDNGLVDLLTAQLTTVKGIELLERVEIDKVLAEHKLSGLFSATNAVELGRILKTDIFAVLETTSIVIFDAQTGLRFVDETLPDKPGDIENAARIVGKAVQSAIEKRKKLSDGKLITFGVLEVRNADFPVARDAWCRAVAGMFERELLRRGGAVLERSRLQLINKERTLTGDATNGLLSSMKLINLEFTRGETAQSFRITVRVGGDTFRAECPIEKPLDAVRIIADHLIDKPSSEALLSILKTVSGRSRSVLEQNTQRGGTLAKIIGLRDLFCRRFCRLLYIMESDHSQHRFG